MRSLLAPTLVIAACSLTVQPRRRDAALAVCSSRSRPLPGSRPQEGLYKRLRLKLQSSRPRQQSLLRGPMRGLLRPRRPQGNQRRKLGDVAITSIPVQARTACPGPSRARAARSRRARASWRHVNTAKTSCPRCILPSRCPRYGEVRSGPIPVGPAPRRGRTWVGAARGLVGRGGVAELRRAGPCSMPPRRVSSATDRAKVPYCSSRGGARAPTGAAYASPAAARHALPRVEGPHSGSSERYQLPSFCRSCSGGSGASASCTTASRRPRRRRRGRAARRAPSAAGRPARGGDVDVVDEAPGRRSATRPAGGRESRRRAPGPGRARVGERALGGHDPRVRARRRRRRRRRVLGPAAGRARPRRRGASAVAAGLAGRARPRRGASAKNRSEAAADTASAATSPARRPLGPASGASPALAASTTDSASRWCSGVRPAAAAAAARR